LLLLEFGIIPDLYLVLGSIAAYQKFSIGIVDRVACDMRAIERLDALADSSVPLVNDRIPASRYECVFVDELHTEDSIAVATIIPLCAFECRTNAFGV